MKLGAPSIAVALAACAVGVAQAQVTAPDAIPFPADSTSEPVVQAWINRYLPAQGYVVGAWSPNVVMLVSLDNLRADAYPQVTTQVLSQALTPDAANAAGWRAAVQVETFACDRNQYQVVSSLYFARADRKGGFDQVAGDGAWHTPDSGATMDTVERTACFYGQPGRAPPAPGAAVTAKPAQAPKSTAPARRKRRKARAPAPKAAPVRRAAPPAHPAPPQ
jgi:hypothetical protein